MAIDRRALLQALGSLALVPGAAAQQSAPTLQQFVALSSALTGYDVDPAAAATLFARFTGPGPVLTLDDLVRAWYAGTLADGNGTQVLLYTDALVWRAMDFTKPMGVCGGATGYWARPPA